MGTTLNMLKTDLAEAIASAFVAVGSDSNKDDLTSHFTFRVRPGGIDVLTYNRICHVRVPVAGMSSGDGEACFSMEAKRLRGCLQSAPGDDIRIQVNNNCSELRVGSWSASIRGLPTARFPFWDKDFEAAKQVARIKVGRLVLTLGYISKFAEQEDTKQPALCAVYVVGGRMQATDARSAAYVDIPEFAGAEFRLYIDAVPRLLNFLRDADPAEEVEVLCQSRYLYVKRQDGAVFGCLVLQTSDPALQSPMKATDAAVTNVKVKKEEMARALSFLDSITSEMEFRVGVRTAGNCLKLSMRGEATNQDEVVDLDATYTTQADVQFHLNRSALKQFLANWKDESVGMDVVLLAAPKGAAPSGYVRFQDVRDDLEFWSLLSWVKR